MNAISGLSEVEAARRLKEDGHNEIPSERRRSVFTIGFEVVRQPMFLLLVACGVIYLVLGDVREALMLLGFVFVVMGITFYQERKTERALEALRDLSSPRALVIRDGEQKRIAGRDVVRGDILILAEGDRVPADAVLLSSTNLSADESLLTGESVPVRKRSLEGAPDTVGEMKMGRTGGDDLPFVYSGTMVVQGQGTAWVQATGAWTQLGKIGKVLLHVEPEETLLQRETGRVVRIFAMGGLGLCILVVIAYGLTRDHWLDGFLAGLTLAMAILPEEIPVVLTIFLALGAWRISQQRVLTRRLPAVETLGTATVLCVDKTGTLTLNRMSVKKLSVASTVADPVGADLYEVGADGEKTLPERCRELVETGVLASRHDSFDPTEKAFKELGKRFLPPSGHRHADWQLVREYPLTHDLLAMSRVWQSPGGRPCVVAAKGAPEAIAVLCRFDGAQQLELSRRVNTMADEGLRVLGVAKAAVTREVLPDAQDKFTFEFVGLVGLADPVRPSVPSALRECYAAGIRVVMITGDYPGTARNVARQIGLTPMGECITGPELDAIDDAELQRRIKTVNLFARVVPEQKLRLVNAFKANGEVVAMTGDGVNDAPALKSAHIGIAMGARGTDVAREAASLVLLEDDFSSIVQAVKLGRRIFDNIKKAVAYTFAIHVPIAGMSLIPVLFKWPLVLLPVHIVFLELIIDPACSIVFEAEPEEADVMTRPPRDPKQPLWSGSMIGLSLLQGASVFLIVLAVFFIAMRQGQGDMEARALTFTTLIIANLALILTNRSWSRTLPTILRSRNPAWWWVVGGALGFLALVLYLPFLRSLFRFGLLHANDVAVCLAAGGISILWFELFKLMGEQQKQNST